MKLKLDDKGNVVLQDGKPVYIHDDGKEVAIDVPATVAKIGALNGEARSHRERAETAESKLKSFEGITDPAAALKALSTIKNLDDKKLVDAGEVEKVKNEAIKAVEEKYSPIVKERDTLAQQLVTEKIGGSFARSKFITDKMAIPADLVQARFGSSFKIEDGKVVAYDHNGAKVFSRAKPGELADFEESLELLVDGYAHKAHILKGSGASGSGAGGSNNTGGANGSKTMTRAQFAGLDPVAQHAHVKEGGGVADA